MPGTVGDAPEAAKPWADKVLAAAESVRSNAEDARNSAGSAQAYAEAAQEAAEGVVTAEAERVQAEQARLQAEQARQEAEKAREEVLPSKLTEPASGLEVGKYFRIAAIDGNGHAVLEAVDGTGGLSTEPSMWPAWTSDEQAEARERMGEFTDSALTTVADVTMDEDANILKAQLAKPCRFVTCTFIIPPEDTGKNRNIYFAANLDGGASVTKMFTRSAPVSTSATMSAFYLASALIVGGKILSFGCIASTGTSILDHQTRALNNPPNGYCVMTADNFESISVFTYGDAFPAGSQLVVTGC